MVFCRKTAPIKRARHLVNVATNHFEIVMKPCFKLVLAGVFFLSLTMNSLGAVTLTNFGNSVGPLNFVVGGGGFTTNQSATSIGFSGTDSGGDFYGSFASKSILGQSDFLVVTGSSSAPTPSAFQILLFDGNFNSVTYTGGLWTGASGLSSGSTILTLDPLTVGSFNFSNVIEMQLLTGGSGAAVNGSLNSLSAYAIPEPSRVMLLGLGLVGLGMRRRRA
jgi:hypothetical protein